MRLLGNALFLAGIGLGLADMSVMYYYSDTRPRVAEPVAGRVIPFNNHGTVGYLTEREHSLLSWLGVAGVAVGGFGVCLRLAAR